MSAHDHVVDQVVTREQRKAHAHEVGEAALVHVVVEPLGNCPRFRAADALVDGDRASGIDPRHRPDQRECTRVVRMARRVLERDHRAEAEAEDDRPLDPQRIAERTDIVGPALEPVLLGRTLVAPAAAAHVQVDDLRTGGEPGPDLHFERVVVESRPRVEEHHGRPLPHPRALGHQLRSLDVEEEADVVDLNAHGATLLSPGIRRNWSHTT